MAAEIDYEALEATVLDALWGYPLSPLGDVARAVVAGLDGQGMMVVRQEDVREARAIVSIYKDRVHMASLATECRALMVRLDAALAGGAGEGE